MGQMTGRIWCRVSEPAVEKPCDCGETAAVFLRCLEQMETARYMAQEGQRRKSKRTFKSILDKR